MNGLFLVLIVWPHFVVTLCHGTILGALLVSMFWLGLVLCFVIVLVLVVYVIQHPDRIFAKQDTHMNEAKHFLEAINAGEPNADLIYADWLEEQGKPEADEIRDPIVFTLREWSWFGSLSASRTRFLSGSRSASASLCQSIVASCFDRAIRSVSYSESHFSSFTESRSGPRSHSKSHSRFHTL